MTKKSWVSTRHTNPLDPTYRVRDDKGTIGGEAEKKQGQDQGGELPINEAYG